MKIMIKKRERIAYLTVSIFLFCFFVLFGFIVDTDRFRGYDFSALNSVQNYFSRSFDLPFSIFTFLGSTEFTFLALAFIFLILLFKKKYFFIGLIVYFSIFIFELIGKFLIYHPVVPQSFNRYIFNFHLPSSFIVHSNFSYPSGHMARSTFVAIILLFLIAKILKSTRFKKTILCLILVLFVIIMSVSRIYLGEHWATDVYGGLLLGSSIAFLAISFW